MFGLTLPRGSTPENDGYPQNYEKFIGQSTGIVLSVGPTHPLEPRAGEPNGGGAARMGEGRLEGEWEREISKEEEGIQGEPEGKTFFLAALSRV
eukprot:756461-Hanusia_phi.AAC.10